VIPVTSRSAARRAVDIGLAALALHLAFGLTTVAAAPMRHETLASGCTRAVSSADDAAADIRAIGSRYAAVAEKLVITEERIAAIDREPEPSDSDEQTRADLAYEEALLRSLWATSVAEWNAALTTYPTQADLLLRAHHHGCRGLTTAIRAIFVAIRDMEQLIARAGQPSPTAAPSLP
jgi:hypothetical protein